MEEGECLPLLKDGDLHTLDTESRTIGSLVHVFCHNVTVAILKCLAGQKWNGTLSQCHTETKSEIMPDEEMKVETIIIIVWVLGGVLLFSLLILLTVILTARHKGGARRPRRRPSIFTVSNERRRDGGDNPAFSTENEQTNWSLHRNSQRLPPTYREAMMDRPPRLEPSRSGAASASSGSPQAGASQDDSSRRYAQEYPSCFWDEEPPPPYSLFADGKGSGNRIISVERTNSNRMAVVQSPRPPRNPTRSTQEPSSSTPPSNHRTIVQCNAQTNQQIIPSTLSNEPRRSLNSSNQQQQHRSTARAQIHQPVNNSSETRRNPRRPDPSHHRERPIPSPQLTRSSNPIEASREPNTLYRCSRLEGTAPLARLEIEYF